MSEAPAPITPDTKDWTWVVERRCPECGFDAPSVHVAGAGALVRANAAAWLHVLREPEARDRPRPDVWSPVEYACHVRDVYRLYDERLALMLAQDDPLYPNWDQDAAAVAERYDLQDPAVVSDELGMAGARIATSFDRVGAAEWGRTGRRSDGATFTVDSFCRYFLHDIVHHLHDVGG
jgi:hypothetical protein